MDTKQSCAKMFFNPEAAAKGRHSRTVPQGCGASRAQAHRPPPSPVVDVHAGAGASSRKDATLLCLCLAFFTVFLPAARAQYNRRGNSITEIGGTVAGAANPGKASVQLPKQGGSVVAEFGVGRVGTNYARAHETKYRADALLEKVSSLYVSDENNKIVPAEFAANTKLKIQNAKAKAKEKFEARFIAEKEQYRRRYDAELDVFVRDLTAGGNAEGFIIFAGSKIFQALEDNNYLVYRNMELVVVETLGRRDYADDERMHMFFAERVGVYSYQNKDHIRKTVVKYKETPRKFPEFHPSFKEPDWPKFDAAPFKEPVFKKLSRERILYTLKTGGQFLLDAGERAEYCQRCNGRGYTTRTEPVGGGIRSTQVRCNYCNGAGGRVRKTRLKLHWGMPLPNIPADEVPAELPAPSSVSTPDRSSLSNALIIARVRKTIFPVVNFQKIKMADAMKILSRRSAEYDPDGKGFEIVFDPGISEELKNTFCSCSLTDTPLSEAVKTLARTRNLGCFVRDGKIVITPATATTK